MSDSSSTQTVVKPQVVDEQEPAPVSGASTSKEREAQIKAEEGIMAEIRAVEKIDEQAIEAVKKNIDEAKAAAPAPEIPPDVEDAGVVHPQASADNVVRAGATLEIPVSNKSYEEGQKTKTGGSLINGAMGPVIVGVSSLKALAIWVGRLVKIAHKRAMKVVFRGGK